MVPGNTNLLSQKYKTLQTEIKATKEKLDTLKEAAKQADQALADGKMSQEQYDALQREIAETEQSLKSLEQEYKNFGSVQAQQVAAAGEKMKEFGGKLHLRHEGRRHRHAELRTRRTGRGTGCRRACPGFMTTRAKSALALISTPVLNYRQARKCFSPDSGHEKFSRFSLKPDRICGIIYVYQYAISEGVTIRGGVPI